MFMALNLSNQFFVSSITLLVIEWLGTLDAEIKYAWKGSRVFGKILFFLTRYPVFAERMLDAYSRTPHVPVSWAPKLGIIVSCFDVLTIVFAELTMTVRVGALWRRNFRIKVLICLMSFINITASIVLNFLHSTITLPVSSGLSERPSAAYESTVLPYIFLVIHQTFLFILTVIKGVEHGRTGAHMSSLMTTLYYDGIIYYALANVPLLTFIITAFLKRDGGFIDIAADMQPVIISILASRLSLHLRHRAARRSRITAIIVTNIQLTATGDLDHPPSQTRDGVEHSITPNNMPITTCGNPPV